MDEKKSVFKSDGQIWDIEKIRNSAQVVHRQEQELEKEEDCQNNQEYANPTK